MAIFLFFENTELQPWLEMDRFVDGMAYYSMSLPSERGE